MVTFRPDGRGARGRVGLLIPHLDPVSETEARVLLPQDVALHVARAPLGMIDPAARLLPQFGRDAAMAFARSPALRSAVARLATLETKAVAYGFTISSYLQSEEEEAAHADMISDVLGGVPVILQARAIADALQALAPRHIALIHPPWVKHELLEMGAAYFVRSGFSVVDNARADVARDMGEVGPNALFSWICARVPDEAEAVSICGGSLRAIGLIDALEDALGRPVVTANQALSWAVMRRIGIWDRVAGYGRLFETEG